jgi:hypothetical protein
MSAAFSQIFFEIARSVLVRPDGLGLGRMTSLVFRPDDVRLLLLLGV